MTMALFYFLLLQDAETAIAGLNGQWLGNKPIRTNWATRKPTTVPTHREGMLFVCFSSDV